MQNKVILFNSVLCYVKLESDMEGSGILKENMQELLILFGDGNRTE